MIKNYQPILNFSPTISILENYMVLKCLTTSKFINWILIIFCLILFNACSDKKEKVRIDTRPNILLLVADDLGYADLGCYGGDIQTPNIDKIATQGIRFSRFHTAPLCAVTRAMMLSGNDNHIAGMGIQSEENYGFGYEGRLTDRVATIPQLLSSAGYHTYMAGKWHLGRDSASIPFSKGFERSYINVRGAGNHYDDQGIFKEDPKSIYFEDDQPSQWNNGDYSTDFFTDKLISYINQNKDDNQPFFAFAAYTSPHWPLQVDEAFWKKYEGKYDDGYEKLKERRLESLIKTGMIPEGIELPPNHKRVKAWDSLSADEKKKESRKMELYAGMVDNLDHNIGRLIQYLKDIGEYENTLIVFMSDNGAAAEDFYEHTHFSPFIKQHFNDDYDNMGEADSFISYGPQWAEAGSSPFRYFKGLTTEGGIVAPMIISGPMIDGENQIKDEFATLLDIAPTFYEAAQVEYPKKFEDKTIYPLKGKSLIPFISNKTHQIHDDDYVFVLEHDNKVMLRKGDWKITNIISPLKEENFKLYHVINDLGEFNDLKNSEPEKFQELLEEWGNYKIETKIQIPSPSW